VIGFVGPVRVLCFAGRVHGYEGYPVLLLTFSTFLAHALGCKTLVVTNASGGCGPGMTGGCVMLVTDHVNLTKNGMMAGLASIEGMPAHVDPTGLYSARLGEAVERVAREQGVPFHKGVYALSLGPTYETVSEVRTGMAMGASAFGMSSVPEMLTAKALGMEALCMSLVTNLASGLSATELSHEEVKTEATTAGPRFQRLLDGFLRSLPAEAEAEGKAAGEGGEAEAAAAATTTTKRRRSARGGKAGGAPLAVAVAVPVSAEEAGVCGAALLGRLGLATCPETLVIAGPGQSLAWAAADKAAEPVALASVAGLPATSATATSSGTITAVTGPRGATVLAVEGVSGSGLTADEAAHLVRVFAAAGGKAVLQGLPSCDPSAPAAATVVSDFASVSFRQPVTGVASQSTHEHATAGGPSYLAFPGPELPTATERRLAAAVGATVWGVDDLSALQLARSLGLKATGVAGAGAAGSSALVAAAHELLAAEAATGTAAPAGTGPSPAKRRRTGGQQPAARFFPFPGAGHPVTQGSYDDAEAAAQFVRGLAGGADLSGFVGAVMAHGAAAEALEALLGDAKSAAYSEVPRWPAYPGRVYVSSAHRVVLFDGTVSPNSGLPLADSALPARVLKHLGVTRVLMVATARPTAAGRAKLGAGVPLAALHDHVLLNGRNVLAGHNEDRWGTRFPDMSAAYCRACQGAVAGALAALGYPAPELVAGLADEPLPEGPLADRLATALKVDALTSSIIPAAVAARHSGLRQAALTLLTDVPFQPDQAGAAILASIKALGQV
jgi:purine-nucleoside phosphorylase